MGLHLSLQPPHAGYSDTLSRHLLPALDWPPLLLEGNLRGWHLLTGWSQLQRHLLLPTLPFPPVTLCNLTTHLPDLFGLCVALILWDCCFQSASLTCCLDLSIPVAGKQMLGTCQLRGIF